MEPQTPLPEDSRGHANRNQLSAQRREPREVREGRAAGEAGAPGEGREVREPVGSGSGSPPTSAPPATPATIERAERLTLAAQPLPPTSDKPETSMRSETPMRSKTPDKPGAGVRFARFCTTPGVDPFDAVEWEVRDAVITNEKGEKVFEQRGVEVPKAWSQTATNVVVSKYFRGQLGSPQREHSVRQLIGRVADTITGWGRKGGYFAAGTAEASGAPETATSETATAATFHAELTHILLNQYAC